METNKKLMEQYEDLLFTIMMEQVMETEGMELLEENKRLKQDPEFVIPEHTNQKCFKTIEKAFSRQKRKEIFHSIYRGFQHVSVAVFALMILFTGVYATVPPVRVAALNLLIEVSDVSTALSFGQGEIPESESITPEQSGTYILGKLPDDLVLVDEDNDSHGTLRRYASENGSSITFEVIFGSANQILRVDTENADSIENIEIDAGNGVLIEKGNQIHVVIGDEEHQVFIDISCLGLIREDVLNLAYGLEYIE